MSGLHPDQAFELVIQDLPEPATEIIPIEQALSRYLVQPVAAKVDQPPFDKSGMDGYAHCADDPDFSGSLRIVGVLSAGAIFDRTIGIGECVRIMTGAPIPPGARAVQRLEYAREEGELVWFTKPETSPNIIRRGENQKAGDTLLGPRRLAPQDIGLLASSGYSTVSVARRATVGVVSTGDELIECGGSLTPGAIFDSNGPQLAAQASNAGCDARYYGIARDEPERLAALISKAISECDVTILSGGVSMGDFDYAPNILESLGVRTVFHGLALRPGKPSYYGRIGDKSVFGLPGNPVSTFVNFEVLVKPHLAARYGVEPRPLMLSFPLAADLKRKGSDRVEYIPAKLEEAEDQTGEKSFTNVRPLFYHGSSMLAALADADCLLRMDMGREMLRKGENVSVRLIRT
jgi:molybdopterin molybdotransferase